MGAERRREIQQAMAERRARIAAMWERRILEGLVSHPIHDAVCAYKEKGYDTSDAEKMLERGDLLFRRGEWDRLLVLISEINAKLRYLNMLDKRKQSEGLKTLEEFESCLPEPYELPPYDPHGADYDRRVLGAWIGKCAGLALGSVPLEGRSRQEIVETHGHVDYYLGNPDPVNDDTIYQIVFLHALEEHGAALTSTGLAQEWVEHIPVELTYTAERIALSNLLQGIMPPDSALEGNPFNEWIGAQMRGEIMGLLFPGRPRLALKYAYLDGEISHAFEGICGEVFTASLISSAFVVHDPVDLIEIALGSVPRESRYAKAVRHIMDLCANSRDWEEAWSRVEESYAKMFHWIHCLPNIGAVIVALLFGKLDFSKSLVISVMCGLDTDCNAGQVGALVGTIVGEEGIPDKWKAPLGNSFANYAIGFEDMSISGFAERTCRLGRVFADSG